MNHRTSKFRTVLAASLSLGLLAGAGQAFAADPPMNEHKGMDADSHKGESHKPVTDSWITTKVKTDLLATKHVSGTEVKVETVNGVVTLSGTVKTQAEHDKAVAVAKRIEGVKSVDASQLNVSAKAKR